MGFWRRGMRITRFALLTVAALTLMLYLAGIPGIWWSTPWRASLAARNGLFQLNWNGPGATVTREKHPVGIGSNGIMSINFGTSAVTEETHDRWLWTSSILRGVAGAGTFPPGPPPRPGSYFVAVQVRLGRLAITAGALGVLLLLVPTRRRRGQSCPSCGYDMAGLAADAVCPECGHSSSVP